MLAWGQVPGVRNRGAQGGEMKMQSVRGTALRSKRHDAGFTVAEFVAAASILLIVLIGVLGAVQFAGASTRMASSRQAAIDLATHQIELARNLPWASVGLKYSDGTIGNPSGSVPAYQRITTTQGTFDVNSSVVWVLDTTRMRSSYKKMTVTVSWSDPNPGGSVSLETNIFGVGGDANTGDVLVTARDADDPTKMVQGVGVTINGQYVPTAVDGTAFFGQVAIGTATFAASSPSYLVDSSGLTLPLIIAAGYQNIGFISCQVPSTAIIKIVGSNGQPLQGASVTLTDTDTKHPSAVTVTSAADGTCVFSGLWENSTSSQPYSVSASYNGSAASGTFLVTAGGQTVNQTLTIVAPSVIVVSVKDSVSGNLITGKSVIIDVTDSSTGAHLAGSPSTVTSGTAYFAITKSGNYNVSVTGVAGYPDSPTNLVSATFGTGANNVTITLSPQTQLQITVRNTSGPTGIPNIPVTVLNPSGTAINSSLGVSPGITGSTGLVTFPILASGSHTVSAYVNKLTYYTSPSPITLLTGQSMPYAYNIDIVPGSIKVTSSGYSSGTRLYAIWDANLNLVTSTSISKNSSYTFTGLVPGIYTVSAFGSGVTLTSSTNKRDYILASPGVQSNTTVTQAAATPN